MLLEESQHLVKGILLHDGVGIEQKDILPPGLPDSLIIRLSKAQVRVIDDEPHPGKLLSYHLHAPIYGSIVHYPDFPGEPSSALSTDWRH